jgi:hypothetical protein
MQGLRDVVFRQHVGEATVPASSCASPAMKGRE